MSGMSEIYKNLRQSRIDQQINEEQVNEASEKLKEKAADKKDKERKKRIASNEEIISFAEHIRSLSEEEFADYLISLYEEDGDAGFDSWWKEFQEKNKGAKWLSTYSANKDDVEAYIEDQWGSFEEFVEDEADEDIARWLELEWGNYELMNKVPEILKEVLPEGWEGPDDIDSDEDDGLNYYFYLISPDDEKVEAGMHYDTILGQTGSVDFYINGNTVVSGENVEDFLKALAKSAPEIEKALGE